MTTMLAMPDDPRRDAVQRLVVVLAHVRREQRRRRRADQKLRDRLDAARRRFDYEVGLALDQWLGSRGIT